MVVYIGLVFVSCMANNINSFLTISFMTCQNCGTRQIVEKDDLICPKCQSIKFLPKGAAINVAQKRVDWFDAEFKQYLSKFNKRRLLVWLFGHREKMASKFFTDIPQLVLNQFLSVNVLIKRVMEDYELPGDLEANEKNTPELIDLFLAYIQCSEEKYMVEEDFGHCIAEKEFNLDTIDQSTLLSNFKFRANEDFIPILESFGDNFVMNKETAKIFIEKHKKEYAKIRKSKTKPADRTPEETINSLFPALQSFFVALTKNKLYANTFSLEYLKEAGISPDFILKFIKKFEQQSGIMTQTTAKQFKRVIRLKFKDMNKNVVYNNLVFSPDNKNVFPFFIDVDNHLLISHNFIRLMGLFYYPFYYKDLFTQVTNKHSEDFENKIVPAQLVKLGFKVIPDYTDKRNPSLQIDQIAWKGCILYVIETKVWGLKPYFEHRRIHGQRERDLKGVG